MRRTINPQTTKGKRRRIKHQSAKGKGRWLQQWACQRISDLTGYEWGSSGEDQPIESRPMGQRGPDVRMESQVRRVFPFTVETKWQESWAFPYWIKQAEANCIEGTAWLLFAKRRFRAPIVVMDGQAFFDLLEKAGIGKAPPND